MIGTDQKHVKMTDNKLSGNTSDTKFTYLSGVGVTHSVAPLMHDQVAKDLGLPWKFRAQECPTIQDVMDSYRAPTFAGGVVTMPYKISVMEHLDGLDDQAKLIGACNNVYKTKDGSLRGTNTDWRGIHGCLASGTQSKTGSEGRKRPALIAGAGGAARAAVYALNQEYDCSLIYIINRDEAEVGALVRDTKAYKTLEIVHITTVATAQQVMKERGHPFFVVGTVPDFAPKSATEIEAQAILDYCFINSPEKGVLLDMCFKPRITRTVKLAQKSSWPTVEGVDVIGFQITEQYRLWTGPAEKSPISPEIQENAWKVLHKAADENAAINF